MGVVDFDTGTKTPKINLSYSQPVEQISKYADGAEPMATYL